MKFPFSFRSPRVKRSNKQNRRTVLGVQLLEERETPAGNVTLSVVNGDMILVGDGAAGGNMVNVTETAANRYTVAGLVGTTINSAPAVDTLTLGTVNRDVKATFSGAANSLTFAGLGPTPTKLRDFTINLSKGGDTINLQGTFGRNVTIKAPNGSIANDSITINAGAGGIAGGFSGNVSIDTQGGTDNTKLSAAIAGNVTIKGKDGGETVTFDSSAIGGAVNVTDTAGMAGNTITLVNNTRISKNLTIANPGAAKSSVAMAETQIGGSVAVTNGSIDGPASTFTATNSTIGQSLSVTGGDGADNFVLTGCDVAKAVTANLKGGKNAIAVVISEIRGNFALSGGSGDDFLALNNSVTIGGNVQANLAEGNNNLSSQLVVITGNLNVSAGAGNDNFNLLQTKIGKNLAASGGKGNNSFSLGQDSFVGGNVAVTNLAGTSHFLIATGANTILGNVSVTLPSGGGTVVISDVSIGGNVAVSNGPNGLPMVVSNAEIRGNLNVTSGSGTAADQLFIDASNIFRNVAFSSGSGNSTFAMSNDANILGNLTLSHSDGVDTFDANTGQNNVFGSVTVNDGAGGSTIALNGLSVGGNLAITNGAGNDTIAFDNTIFQESFGGNVTINNGAGANVVSFVGKSATEQTRINGNLTISGTTGADVVVLRDLMIGGATNVSTGANNDTVVINDDTFTGNAKFDLGADNDTLVIDTDNSQPGRTEFLGSLTMNLGSGTDTLQVAGNVPATTVLVYGALSGDFRTAAEASLITANAIHVGFPTF